MSATAADAFQGLFGARRGAAFDAGAPVPGCSLVRVSPDSHGHYMMTLSRASGRAMLSELSVIAGEHRGEPALLRLPVERACEAVVGMSLDQCGVAWLAKLDQALREGVFEVALKSARHEGRRVLVVTDVLRRVER